MESKETAQMLLTGMIEVRDTLSTLNERSKNYYELLGVQEKRIKVNEDNNKDNLHRIEKIELSLANLKVVEDHTATLKQHSEDITKLKRDRYWIGIISGIIGSIIIPLVITLSQDFVGVVGG